MFEDMKMNIEQEKKIVADMRAIAASIQNDSGNKSFYLSNLKALAGQLSLLNDTVPELLKEWTAFSNVKVLPVGNQMPNVKKTMPVAQKKTVRMSYISQNTKEKKLVTINEKDRKEFLKKLQLSEASLKKIRQIKSEKNNVVVQQSNVYAGFSNKYFRKYSESLTWRFDDLNKDLKKANVRFLLASYLSMAMMSMTIAFIFGMMIFGILLVVSLSNWIYFVLPLGLVGLVLAGFYLYPASEASSVEKNISYELPFATIHMAAIAGSNIPPLKIFKIIIKSGEYPNFGAEVQKVVTQVDVYGYDLVTSLKNVAVRTSNKRLAELFSGLATNISGGGALKNYLEKKSENFLVDYRLERQEYSALAGTFMDVYISILIAAPLVLMMMFIVMNVSGLGMGGLGIQSLMFLSIGAIVITNIIFIVVLNMKQPRM